MAPRNLIQDTIDYNRKINSIRKKFKSKTYTQSIWPSKFIRTSPIEVSVKPIDLPSSIGHDQPRKFRKSLEKGDYIPPNVPQRDFLPKKNDCLDQSPPNCLLPGSPYILTGPNTFIALSANV